MSTLNFQQALELITNISDNIFIFDVWVPSIKSFIKFKEINTEQQKNIIEFYLDPNKNEFNFTKILYSIIKENCKASSEVIENFTIFDYSSIAFSLRNKISNTISVEKEETEEIFDLSEIVENYKSSEYPKLENISYSDESIKIEVELAIPTISEEIKFNEVFYSKIVSNGEKDNTKELLTNMFLIESSKHVKSIKINDNLIDYLSINEDQKIEIIKLLPTTFTNKVLDKMKEYKDYMYKLQVLTKNDDKKLFEVNGSLFMLN